MLRTTIGGVSLDCCIYNASGPRTVFIDDLSKLNNVKCGAILSKSSTVMRQDGNPLPRTIPCIELGNGVCEGSLNSEGLPNMGLDYYVSDDALQRLSKFGRPYIISLAGCSLQDNIDMISKVLDIDDVAAIELNLACPNIPGKAIIAYDFDELETVLKQVAAIHPLKKKPVGIKLAPYFDLLHFDRAASIIAKYPIQYVVTANSMGNCLVVDYENECSSILPKGGLGGLGGGYLKPAALANVHILSKKFSEYGRNDIDIVGVGGVASGKDAFELILCGASAVQVGTCHWNEGPACFDRIAGELEDIMKSKGYSSIQDFRGKLKSYFKSKATKTICSTTSKSKADVIVSAKSKQEHVLLERVLQMIIASIIVLLVVLFFTRYWWAVKLCNAACVHISI